MATMKHLSLCLMLLCLAACGDNSTPPARIPTNNWVMSYSQGTALSVAAGELWQFDFPAYPGHVNMVTKSTGALTGQQLTAVFEEDESGPIWFWAFDAGNTCNPGSPPQTHLYFQRAGDDMSGVGGMQYYRWWSRGIDITPVASNTVTIGLDPSVWTSVFGQPGTANPTMFAAALANAANVGLVFGGGCFAGHGVAVKGGSATFKLKSFQ
jgi:hypothetical protein